MEIQERTEDQLQNKTTEFAKRLINLQKEKKAIDSEIKALKTEYKLEGVPTGKVTKVVNSIKSKMKQSPLDKAEEESIEDSLKQDDNLMIDINDLVLST